MPHGIGIDIGATYTRVVIADEKGNFITKISEKTVRTGDSTSLANQLISMIKKAIKETGIEVSEIKGIGVGSIGPLDYKKGILLKPANLPFNNIPITEPLSKEFGLRTVLLNDCTTAVIGEKFFGAGKEHENLVYVTISTGIGGGAYVDGHLLIGKDGNAVEIGHMVIDAEGKLVCGCGKMGHWEAYSSGSGIPKYTRFMAKKEWDAFRRSLLYKKTGGDLNSLDSKMVYEAAKEGDEFALRIVEKIGKYNSIGFANIINIYDPSLITIGGSVALYNKELILDPILKYLDNYVINRKPKIIITPLGGDIVLYGALALALGMEKVD